MASPDRTELLLQRELEIAMNGSSQQQRERFGLSNATWASLGIATAPATTIAAEVRKVVQLSYQSSPVRVTKSRTPLSRRNPPANQSVDGGQVAQELFQDLSSAGYTTYKTSTETLTVSSSGTVLRMPSASRPGDAESPRAPPPDPNAFRHSGHPGSSLVDQDPNSPFALKAAWARFCERAAADFSEHELCLVSCDTLRLLMSEYGVQAPEEVAQIEAQWALIQVEMNHDQPPVEESPPLATSAAPVSSATSPKIPSPVGRSPPPSKVQQKSVGSARRPPSSSKSPSKEGSPQPQPDMNLRTGPAKPHLSKRSLTASRGTPVLCDPNTCVLREASAPRVSASRQSSQRHEDHLLGAFPVRGCPPPLPSSVRCNIEPQQHHSPEGIRTDYRERRDVSRSVAYDGAVVGQPPHSSPPSAKRVFYDTAATSGPPLLSASSPRRRFSSFKNVSSIPF